MRATAVLVIALWSILLLGWLTLHWGILPHINEWRGRVEQQATEALGVPVHIGHIEVRSSGWVPVFELLEVTLQDGQGHTGLHLPRVSAALAPNSLLALELRFAQLHLRDVQLEVRRDAAGHLHVGGLALPDHASGEGSEAADWFLAQHEFVIENGALNWVDETHATPDLALQQVQLVVRNGLRRHDWKLSATPPDALGQRFSLTGRFTQPLLARAGDWQRWSGTVYAELPAAHLGALGPLVAPQAGLQAGDAAVRAWVDLEQGHWRRAVADTQWAGLDWQAGPGLPPLRLAQASLRFTAEQNREGLQLAAQDLRFQTPDGLAWPASRVRLAWPAVKPGTWPDFGHPQGGELAVDSFDLAEVNRLVARLPLPAEQRQRWAALGLKGQVQGLQARWQGPHTQPTHYHLQGRATGLAMAPGQPAAAGALGRPGWSNLDLGVDASETGGQATLALRQGALWLPGVFAEPELPLKELGGKLVWTLARPAGAQADAPPDIDVHLQDGRFANADAQGQLQLHWRTGRAEDRPGAAVARWPGVLDLSGTLHQARASAVARYLPLSVGASVRSYVAAAVQDGQIPRASFKVRGPLQDFPFADRRSGEFHLAAQIAHGVLAYVPDAEAAAAGRDPQWPPFSEVQGELVFDRGAMEIHNAQARLWGISLQHVNGAIRSLAHQPVLSLQGEGRGPLNDALRYVGATPVGAWTHHALGQAAGTGDAELKLQLDIPLDDTDHTRVDGSVALTGNDLRLRPDMPLMAGARARVHFTDQGFNIQDGSARLLGGDATVEGGSTGDGSVRIRAQGTVSAEGLRRAAELGPVTRLAGLLSGQTPYQFELGFTRGQIEYSVRSPLTGLALDLPAPLHKTAAERWPLLVQARLADDGASPASRDTLQVELGPLLQAQWQRDLSGPAPRVLRGAIGLGLGQALPELPAQGVSGAATLGEVHVDAWMAAARRLAGLVATPNAPNAAPTRPPAGPAEHSALAYLPAELQVKAQALAVQGKALTQVQARLQRRGNQALGGLHVQLAADQAQGEADWQAAAGPQSPTRVMLHLARLDLPLAGVPAADATPAPPLTATDDASPAEAHPTLDITVDALGWRQQPLGKLELAASGTPRDWRVSKLSLANADAVLSGSGRWAAKPAPRMDVALQLQLNDSGALLERVGLGKVLRHGRGQIKAQLQWPGSPLEPSLATLSGQAQVALDSGQFLQVEPGVGRLLGMVNLQSLPRRLALDFRDLYEQGFGFDNISGDLRLEAGVARTNNLRVRGVQAVVLMEGHSDLQRETQDLHVLVVPEINAGTASLAYAAINPAVGLGTFLAQYLLRDTLQQAGTREFRITGTWDHPVTEDGERGTERPTAAASAAGNSPR